MAHSRYGIGTAVLAGLLTVSGTVARGQPVLNIYNWTDYIAEDTIANFEREYGVRVNYDVFDSNQVLAAKLLAGNSGYDLVVPTIANAQHLIEAGIFRRLDKSRLTNYGNLDPVILKQVAIYDPDNAHAVPYMWGTNGYGYNVAKVAEAAGPNAPTDSWALLFDPEWAAKVSACGLAILDDPGEVVDPVLAYIGRPDEAQTAGNIAEAMDRLVRIRPSVTYFHSSQYINDLANGNVCVAMGWSGDVGIAAARAEEAGNGIDIEYVIPKEGTLIWFDTMMIPADAPNPDLAHVFIDYILRAKVSADISNYVTYAGPNLAAMPYIDDGLKNDPGTYPPEDVKQRLKAKIEPEPRLLKQRTRLWTRMKTGK